MQRTKFLLSRRFGLIYTLLVATLAGTFGVVAFDMHRMRVDSAKLLEESRETGKAARLLAELDTLDVLVAMRESLGGHADAVVLPVLAQRCEVASACVAELFEPSAGDPSRPEHQRAEDKVGALIRVALAAVAAGVAKARQTEPLHRVQEQLSTARRGALVLVEETRVEAALADDELERLIDRSIWVIWGSVLFTAFVLVFTLVQILRRVVGPLRRLRQGAERLGAGDLGHRIGLRSRDELGDLSLAFDTMAGRLLQATGALQAQVQSRTEQFVQASRLADFGTIAAGVAHEINNPLASIANCAEGLQRRLRAGAVTSAEQDEYLQTIASEAWRVRDITSRLLTLARVEPGRRGHVDLAQLCQQIERLARHRCEAAGVTLSMCTPESVADLHGNAGELMQMLLNLLLNAVDASPRGSTVWIRCAIEPDQVVFEVEDQGPGVAAEDVPRIFEPFYTTKAPGAGTGLGLPIVASIVRGHGGSLDVRRGERGGALFVVALPRGGTVDA